MQSCNKIRCCCHCFHTFCKFIFAVGTLLLGWAACFKLPEINSAVEKIQNLNSTVELLRKVETQNSEILTLIKSKVDKILVVIGSEEPNDKSKLKLSEFLMKTVSVTERNWREKFKEQEQAIVEGAKVGGKYEAQATVMPQPESEDSKEINKIVNKWSTLKSKDDRVKYISNIYENFLKTGNMSSSVVNIDHRK